MMNKLAELVGEDPPYPNVPELTWHEQKIVARAQNDSETKLGPAQV